MYLFEIHQKPVPQKQTRFAKGRRYDPSSLDKQSIIWQIRYYAPKEPFDGACQVDLTFYMPMPKSSKIIRKNMINGVILPTKRPDVDNLAYLITNSMKGIFYIDDSQVVDLNLHKRYAEEPRTVVKIIQL